MKNTNPSSNKGILEIVDVEEVGEDALLRRNEQLENPFVAMALARLASGPFMPTPMGVFRAVEHQEYSEEMTRQIVYSQEVAGGSGNLEALLHSRTTWEVASN